MEKYIEPGYKIVKNDEGVLQYQLTLHFDVGFEMDNGTYNTLEEDLGRLFVQIADDREARINRHRVKKG